MNSPIAIVGMEARFGRDECLDAFDRTIFEGLRQSADPVEERPKKVRAGTKSEYREGGWCSPGGEREASSAPLLRTLIESALPGTASPAELSGRDDLAAVFIADREGSGPDTGVSRVYTEPSLFSALEKAQGLLSREEVQGVVLAAVDGLEGEGGEAAVFLKRADRVKKGEDRVFAIIDAVAGESFASPEGERPSMQAVRDACDRAFQIAGVEASEIGYLELSGLGGDTADQTEIETLVPAYPASNGAPACGIGDVRSNIPDVSVTCGLARVIKAVLCLYHRYIPSVPGWTGPRNEALWEESGFYTPTESRPWFLDPSHSKRRASVSHVERAGITHLILSEDMAQRDRPNRYLKTVAPYCFPVAGNDAREFAEQLRGLEESLQRSASIMQTATENLAAYKGREGAAYALMIVGHTKADLLREVQFMLKGVPDGFEKGTDLRTPKGSFFTANPLGEEGKVAFVYPGVGSAYVGLGQAIFHLLPELYDAISEMTPDMGASFKEHDLYPRGRLPLSEDDIWKKELLLRKDIMTIGECGMSFFVLFTMVLKDCFKVIPQSALGYSMGEPGMIASLGVWQDPGQLAGRFTKSPTFRERLHGDLSAVREAWNLKEGEAGSGTRVWDSFTLQATVSDVTEALAGEDRVYLTIINSPDEVVIGGDPERCSRVIKKLGCKHYPLGLSLALHSEPTRVEYERIVELYTLPVREKPEVKFYSSSCYLPIPIRSKAIAHSIAKAYCEPVDFPRLVDRAYEDGARLFIEIGSRKFCSNLIEKILKGKDHLAMAINVKGTKDQASLVRILAQLVSHRVPVDLSPLF